MKIMWVTVGLAIFAGPNALAQETLVDHLISACESDIENTTARALRLN